jgi:asparagine synthase (glutamine-hydrolysing)
VLSSDQTALAPIEVATGLVFGRIPVALPPATGATPLECLERAIRGALERPPCLVSFSGGRDSSCVLGTAVGLARREGLPLPVPATLRFPAAAGTIEDEWQEHVVAHIRPGDWLRLDLREELDPVGPIAVRGLERHGLLWPFNAHFHVPLLEAARGGSLLTGIGGDEVFGESRWLRANLVLGGRARPRPRDVLAVALALAPPIVRRAALRSRVSTLPWLTSTGRRVFARSMADREAGEPRGYRARLEWWHGLRSHRFALASLNALASDADALVVNPFADEAFASALAAFAPASGPANRGVLLEEVFRGLLPQALYRRRTKVFFDEAFWGSHSRALAASWEGEGADASLVDGEALRREWERPVPDPHTFTVLQAAYLARRRSSGGAGH